MIEINGKTYARNDKEFTASLFCKGGTCVGYYRKSKNGLIIMNMQKEPIAHLTRNRFNETIFGNARNVNGRMFYQGVLSSHLEEQFGLAGLGYLAAKEYAENLFNRLVA